MQTFSLKFRLDIRALLSNGKNYVMYLGFMIVVKLPRVVNYPVRCAMSPLLLAHSRPIKGKTKTPAAHSLLAPGSPGIRLSQLSRFPYGFPSSLQMDSSIQNSSAFPEPKPKRVHGNYPNKATIMGTCRAASHDFQQDPPAPVWRLSFPPLPLFRALQIDCSAEPKMSRPISLAALSAGHL